MFQNIENLKIISVINRSTKHNNRIEGRQWHSLFLRISGSVTYLFPDREITAHEGDIVFLPQGSTHTNLVLTPTATYTAIHFSADFGHAPLPACHSLEGFRDTDYICRHLSDLWNFGSAAEKYQCYALLYTLLAYLADAEAAAPATGDKFQIIEPAVQYLKAHIYDHTLKAEKLPRLCGISGTYFRQIFQARFGTTPQNYILSKRIDHAKAILSSGDFLTITEVAMATGFHDPLYFSKVFKRVCGVAPSEMGKG